MEAVAQKNLLHFTYQSPEDKDLCQGDIVSKDQISHIIREVHPRYLKEDYTHFIVLSQTCDLVRGRGHSPCKTRYISVAAIRPLDLVLERELEKDLTDIERNSGLCSKKHYSKISVKLRQVYDNNFSEYFYLHEESNLKLHVRSCAFLRLSIALRAEDHYEALLAARVASLSEGFRAKLGWTVGNLYSRVGTPDWVPDRLSKKDFNDMIDLQLQELFVWVEKEKIDGAKRDSNALKRVTSAGQDALKQFILEQEVVPKKDRVLKAVKETLINEGYVTKEETVEEIAAILSNNPVIKSIKD